MSRSDMFGTKTREYVNRSVIVFKTGELFNTLKQLSRSERDVLDFILKYMVEDMNTITMSKDTRARCLEELGFANSTISNALSALKKFGFIDKTLIPNEYVVHPTYAIAGNEAIVYKVYSRLELEAKKNKDQP